MSAIELCAAAVADELLSAPIKSDGDFNEQTLIAHSQRMERQQNPQQAVWALLTFHRSLVVHRPGAGIYLTYSTYADIMLALRRWK